MSSSPRINSLTSSLFSFDTPPASSQVSGSPASAQVPGAASRTVFTQPDNAPTSVQLSDGTQISLPTLSDDDKDHVQNLFGSIPPEKLATVSQASQDLAAAIYKTVGLGTNVKMQPMSADGADSSDDDSADDSDPNSTWSVPPTNNIPNQQDLTSSAATQMPALQAIPTQGAQSLAAQSNAQTTPLRNDVAVAGQQTPSVATLPNTSVVAAQGSSQVSLRDAAVGINTAGANAAAAQPSALSGTGQAPTAAGTGGPQASVVAPAVAAGITQAGQAYVGATGTNNYDKTVEAVTYMGILGLQNQLYGYAQTVQNTLNNKNQTRIEATEIQQAVAEWPANQATQQFTWTTYDQYGVPTKHTENLTRDQAAVVGQNLQDQLSSMNDTTEMQQMQLQDITQKYQEGVNTLSNMLKFQHDTVKSIINNIHT